VSTPIGATSVERRRRALHPREKTTDEPEAMALQPSERSLADGGDGSAPSGLIRMRCVRCGADVQAQNGFRIAGQCSTCDSYELEPLLPPQSAD